MLITRLCVLFAIAAAACTSATPPLEESCAPLKAEWEEKEALRQAELRKSIRQEVETEFRNKHATAGPTIGQSERQALERAALTGKGKVPSGDEPVIEGTPAPEKLTKKDRAALADDPANGAPSNPTAPPVPLVKKSDTSVVSSPTLDAGNGSLKLKEIVIALGVEDRQPISPGLAFDAGPQQFFCYTVYDSAEANQASTHVWRYKEKVLSRVELNVGKSPSWRTWSRHRARPSATGQWSCEVLDGQGNRLGQAHFTVGK